MSDVTAAAVRGVSRYAARGTSFLTPLEREAAACRYASARAKLAGYEARVRVELESVNLEFVDRRKVTSFCRRAYRLLSHLRGAVLAERLGIVVSEFGRRGLCPELALRVLGACARAKGYEMSDGFVRIVKQKRRESMNQQMEKAPKRRKRRPKTHPGFDLGVSADALLNEKSELEQIREENALKSLREALSSYKRIIRECVVRRLLEGLSHKALARRLDLTEDEVAGILTTMRPRVARLTSYFDEDWIWQDGATIRVSPDRACAR